MNTTKANKQWALQVSRAIKTYNKLLKSNVEPTAREQDIMSDIGTIYPFIHRDAIETGAYVFTNEKRKFEDIRKILIRDTINIPDETKFDNCEQELAALAKIIKSNPFPRTFIDSIIYDDAKYVYENLCDTKALKEWGVRRYSCWNSLENFRCVYYWIVNISPVCVTTFSSAIAGHNMSSSWDGVGTWRH